jgi:hypothetical protein
MQVPSDVDSAARDAEGWVRIVGFGSLLARSSAERSFPDLRDWRLVRIPRCCRVFGHAAPVFFERGIAAPRPPFEFASLCAEPCKDSDLPMLPNPEPALGSAEQFALAPAAADAALSEGRYMYATAFCIPPEAMAVFREREPEFAYVAVQPYAADCNERDGQPAIMCGRGSDELLLERLGGESEAGAEGWRTMVSGWGITSLWGLDRETLLPCRPYLRFCVLASEALDVRDNFIDTTFLADRRTTVREYLLKNPTLMSTLPPESVRAFYTL